MEKPTQFLAHEKPLVYLDHNILNLLANDKNHYLFKELKNYTVIYSFVTLEEIRKSNNYMKKKFLDLLYELDGFLSTFEGAITKLNYSIKCLSLSQEDPYIMFEIYESHPVHLGYNNGYDIKDAFFLPAFMFHGGNKRDLNVKGLLENLAQHPDLELLENENEESFFQSLSMSEEKKVPRTIDDIRKELNINPKVLNNIPPKYAVEKIKEILLQSKRSDSFYASIIDNFSQNETMSYDINEKVEKSMDVYSGLNTMGYHSDRDMDKLHDFNSSRHDALHVSMAIFSDRLYTADRRLAMKAKATYYHLGIPVEVKLISPKGDRLIE